MGSERIFRPLSRRSRTGGSGPLLLGAFAVLAFVAVVARATDRSWWITPAVVAVVLGVTAPIAFWVAWNEGVGRSLTVTRETITMTKTGRRGERSVVVRRDAAAYAAAFGAVRRGPDMVGSDRTLLVTDGQRSIRLVDASWGPQTLRDIASTLEVPFSDDWITRADLVARVGGEAALWERRPLMISAVVAGTVVVVALVAATVAVVLA